MQPIVTSALLAAVLSSLVSAAAEPEPAAGAAEPEPAAGADSLPEKKESNTSYGKKSWKEGQVREKKLKFTYKEQKEWETIEDEIAGLEEAVGDLEEEILAAARDFGRLNTLMKEKEEKEQALEEKMERWMYLNDLAEQIEAQNK